MWHLWHGASVYRVSAAASSPSHAVRAATDDISPAMREFPHRRFLVMGALDTCFNLLSTWYGMPLQLASRPVPRCGVNTKRVACVNVCAWQANLLGWVRHT